MYIKSKQPSLKAKGKTAWFKYNLSDLYCQQYFSSTFFSQCAHIYKFLSSIGFEEQVAITGQPLFCFLFSSPPVYGESFFLILALPHFLYTYILLKCSFLKYLKTKIGVFSDQYLRQIFKFQNFLWLVSSKAIRLSSDDLPFFQLTQVVLNVRWECF